MPRISRLTALETVIRPRVAPVKRRVKPRLSGTNAEPLGVRKTEILPSKEEIKAEEDEHVKFMAGRKAEWKRRQDVCILMLERVRPK